MTNSAVVQTTTKKEKNNKLYLRCKHCGYTTKVTKELFAKILGGLMIGTGFKAWLCYLFAGTGFALPLCGAIIVGGTVLVMYGGSITKWMNKSYSCPHCHRKNWETFSGVELEQHETIHELNKDNNEKEKHLTVAMQKQQEAENSLRIIKEKKKLAQEFFGANDSAVLFDKDIRVSFETAIKKAKSEILIACPFVGYKALFEPIISDDSIADLLIDALKRGVTVKIHYGIDNNLKGRPFIESEVSRLEKSKRMMGSLQWNAKEYKSLLHIKQGNSHIKVLIIDGKYGIAGSFNLLSFDGSYKYDTRMEEMHIISEEDIMDCKKRLFDF